MVGNLQLFISTDGYSDGYQFNMYAYTMTHNPLIKIVSYGNYFFILLHAIQGILISIHNKRSKGIGYEGKDISDTDAKLASRNMIWLGVLILAFLGLHMWQFWAQMHFSRDMNLVPESETGGLVVKDLYITVKAAFSQAWVVIVYLISLVALSLHLLHGFWSAFQSMGLNNNKYSPIIRALGIGYAILIPLGFATMPVYFYVSQVA
jgi:succinate dehydrogenase / fumarate reductase cytochrome b subunit